MARRRRDEDDDDDLPRKRASRRDEDDDDLDEELDDDVEAAPRPRDNAYTGILVISFLALALAALVFYLDHSELSATTLPQPNLSVPGLGEEKQAITPPGK